jgi:hypothetical protein
MNVNYFSCALIEFLVSKSYELIEVKMILSKPHLRRKTKRERSRARSPAQLVKKPLMTRRAIRDVDSDGCQFVFC